MEYIIIVVITCNSITLNYKDEKTNKTAFFFHVILFIFHFFFRLAAHR